MKRADVVRRIREVGVVPVVRADSAAQALQVCDAILAGGLPLLEITLTVPGATDLIAQLDRRLGGVVGAGSVTDAAGARACIAAGARFVVSPALSADVIAVCREQDVAVLPGALTPTEILQAWRAGADLVKVFPAAALGGPAYVRALKGPLPHVELLPTGGVTLATVAEFLAAGAAAVGAGGDLADPVAVRRGDAAAVTATARAYVEAVRKARAHGR